MKYEVIQADSLEELERTVADYIANGFQCQGGISVITELWVDGIERFYYQAMIRPEAS